MLTPKILRITTHIILLSAATLFFTGFFKNENTPEMSKYTETGILMGTIIKIDFCYEEVPLAKREEVFESVWHRLKEIHWRMSVFDDKSDVNKVNSSYPDPVAIKADTYQLLSKSKKLSTLTNGAFDITVWPMIKLWKESSQKNQIPSPENVHMIKEAVGFNNINLLEDNQVQRLHHDTKIDLGGIAKGYAVDEAARILRENEFTDFLIDAGGDIYVGGSNCQREPWRIGIRDPRDITNTIDRIQIRNAATATSGDYHQFFEIQGQQFSHIINPITGYPQQGVVSVSVVAPDATEADALATALTVLDPHDGIKLIEQLGDDYAAMIVTRHSEEKITKIKSKQFKKLSNLK